MRLPHFACRAQRDHAADAAQLAVEREQLRKEREALERRGEALQQVRTASCGVLQCRSGVPVPI